jgi:hypothetical protein
MPPVVPAVTEKNEPKIDDNVKKTEGFGSVNNASYLPPTGNENMEREQEEEDEDEEKNPLDQTVFLDQTFLDDLDKEIQDEKDLENDQNIEDEQDKDQAINEAVTQVKGAVDQINEKITVLEETGKKTEADAARDASEQLRRIQDSMNEVRGWNFAVVPQKEQEQGFISKFWNRATGLFAKVSKLAVNIVTAPIAVYKYVSSNNTLSRAREKMQQSRNFDTIPGWQGARFNRPENEQGEDMIYDERRVPIVWSYMTAGRAEIEENGKKVPAPPEVAIMVHQPTPGSATSMNGPECGHVMLGITYTRYSNITKRNERYSLQYGFYPGGGLTKWNYTGVMYTLDATLPGQLMDDSTTAYSISKRYPATMAQVGRILKQSEHYADGGYSYYRRNCTTFVRDMTVTAGNILSDGDSIFQEAEVRLDTISGLGKVGLGAVETYANASAKNNMAGLADKDDLSYQGFGNKRVTKEDIDRYQESIKNPDFTKKTLIPAQVGENLRMNKGDKGIFGSYEYTGTDNKVSDSTSIGLVYNMLTIDARKLDSALEDILTSKERAALPENLKMLVADMQSIGVFTLSKAIGTMGKRFEEKGSKGKITVEEYLTDTEIMDTRIELSDQADLLSELYYTYLKGDKRINTLVMNTLSQIQRAITLLDIAYRERIDSKFFQTEGDLGNVNAKLNSGLVTLVISSNKSVLLPATLFEAYLQSYNFDIKSFLKDYLPYDEIKNIPEEDRTSDQDSTFARLESRLGHATAFANAHKYMLERKTYTQQDIDYVMNLALKEQFYTESQSAYFEGKTAGAIYQKVIFDKVFGGISSTMNQISTQDKKTDGLPLEVLNGLEANSEEGFAGTVKWFDAYFVKSIRSSTDLVKMILKSLKEVSDKKYGGVLKPDEIKTYVKMDFFEILRMYVDGVIEAHMNDEFFKFLANITPRIMERFKITPDVAFFRELEALI